MASSVNRSPCAGRSFHVDWDDRQGRWDVVDEDGRVIGHRTSRDDAIAFAVEQAQQVHGQGEPAAVCVEQKDGNYRLAWSA